MIREIEGNKIDCLEKVLVCLTNREKPKELIDEGAKLAEGGELHIMYVQKGESIFSDKKSPEFMEELFRFASEKGGAFHFYCDTDILECVKEFVKENGITKVVLKGIEAEKGHTEKFVFRPLKSAVNFIYRSVDIVVV